MGAAATVTVAADPARPPLRPWWAELGSVLPRSVAYAMRAALPAGRTGREEGLPRLAPSPLTWASVAVDEFAMSAAYLAHRRRAREVSLGAPEESAVALRRLRRAGVLADPARLFPAPQPPPEVAWSTRRRAGVGFDHVSFPSTWRPPARLPAAIAWDAPDGNGRVHAFLRRHGDRDRPWLLVLHGHRMGEPRDLRLLGSAGLHRELGVDVAHLVLPLHGPRARGLGHPFPGVDPVLNLIGMAQAVHDARALLGVLHDLAPTPVAVYGVSLGGHVAALLAGHQPGLAAVIAGVPTSDVSTMLATTMADHWGERVVADSHVLDGDARELSRLVSPLSYPPLPPRERRFLYAAVGDRLVTPQQALALWRHWDRPAIRWLQGGHILNNGRAARRFVALALRSCGVVGD